MSINHSVNLLIISFGGISIEPDTVDLGVLFNQVFDHVSGIRRSGRGDLLNVVITARDRVRLLSLLSLSLHSCSYLWLDVVVRNHVIDEICVIVMVEDSVCVGSEHISGGVWTILVVQFIVDETVA